MATQAARPKPERAAPRSRPRAPRADERPRAGWVEDGDDANLVLASNPGAAYADPPNLAAALPDGRKVVAAAATLCLRFRRVRGRWKPVAIEGSRVMRVKLERRLLFSSATPVEDLNFPLTEA